MSQLDLACEADISTRHLSFVETGRSQPSREMLFHLAERLDIPLRNQNEILVAAGYAPVFPQTPLADPAMQAVRAAMDQVLAGHEPYPALAIDRHWTLVAANAAVGRLLEGVDPALLEPPVNVLRLGLHPNGLAPRTVNLAQWRAHLLHRLHRQIDVTADPVLGALMHELRGYPAPPAGPATKPDHAGLVVPLQLRMPQGVLSLFSTTMVFGTSVDVTVSELTLETIFPADAASAEMLRAL